MWNLGKVILTGMTVMAISTGVRAEDPADVDAMRCSIPAGGITVGILRGIEVVGHISHKFTTARLTCPISGLHRLKNRIPLVCAGVWEADRDPQTGRWIDTIAAIRLVPTEDEGWSVHFRTTKMHGAKLMAAACEVLVDLKPEN